MALVSAVIPTFNRFGTLRRAIDSVLNQRGSRIEIIVVDDGSTDDTQDLLSQYGSQVRVLTQPRMGAAAARNSGIATARGDFVAFLDSDDEWLPEKTRIQLQHFDTNPRLGIVGCGASFMDGGRIYDIHWQRRQSSLRKRLLTGPINTSGVIVRSTCLHLLKTHFRTDLQIYEDSELWWRLAARHDSLMLPELLVKSHRAGSSVSTSIKLDEKLLTVGRFYQYVLADEEVRLAIGEDLKAFVAHRHYIASCAYYVNCRYGSAWAQLLAGVRANPLNYRWLKLGCVVSIPPSFRPALKRSLDWIARRV